MQEIMKDGSVGEIHVANTIEDLVPYIRRSLGNPNVKFVKVFRGKTLVAGLLKPGTREQEKFVAEEEKKNMKEQIIEDDKKEKKGKKKYRKRFFNE